LGADEQGWVSIVIVLNAREVQSRPDSRILAYLGGGTVRDFLMPSTACLRTPLGISDVPFSLHTTDLSFIGHLQIFGHTISSEQHSFYWLPDLHICTGSMNELPPEEWQRANEFFMEENTKILIEKSIQGQVPEERLGREHTPMFFAKLQVRLTTVSFPPHN